MEPSGDEVKRLEDCINDLMAVLALAAVWSGQQPEGIVSILLDALISLLRLDFVYAWLNDPVGGAPIEMVRSARSPNLKVPPLELARQLKTWLGDNPWKLPSQAGTSIEGEDFSIAPLRLGLRSEIGAIVAGSQRADFPDTTERLLLNIAANQAVIALQDARESSVQKRLADELEQKIAHRTKELATLVDSLPALVAVMSLDGELEFTNARVRDYFGRSLDQLKRWTMSDAVYPDDLSYTIDTWRHSIETGKAYDVDHRLRRADGVYRWFHAAGSPMYDVGGHIIHWYVLLTDIHERKTAEEKVAQQTRELATLLDDVRGSETKLRRVIDTIPTLAWCNLTDGSNEFLNKRWHDYTGLSPEESHGWGWQASFHSEDLPPLMDKWRELLASGEPGEIEARIRRHDGAFRWFLIRVEPLRDGAGEIIRWYGTSTDIEERKRAEEKLRQDERELRQITDSTAQIIIVEDAEGIPIYANRAALDYTGLTINDVTRTDFRPRILHPKDLERLREERKAALSRSLPFEIEQRALRKDGQYRWFLIRYNPFHDERGRIIRWYATGTDIEDRKQAEDRTHNENLALREEITRSSMFEEIVGSSGPLRNVLAQVTRVAPTDSTVLISGETGTGKELMARAIHKRSNRSTRPFISVNCGAIPQSLITSELFGHEKGAFTGALQRRTGRFEAANGGTIFLDEIAELPMETQIALLRVLQEREFERIGGSETLKVDVRVLAATNRDLKQAVSAGTFRQDLFYRLNVFPIEMPPLRERADDIQLLAKYMIDRYAKKAGKRFEGVETNTLHLLNNYQWPGNVRELQNVIERAVVLCDGPTFSVDSSWLNQEPALRLDRKARAAPFDSERALIEAALAETHGRVSGSYGAAVKLGIPRQTLESKILRLGIKKHQFKS